MTKDDKARGYNLPKTRNRPVHRTLLLFGGFVVLFLLGLNVLAVVSDGTVEQLKSLIPWWVAILFLVVLVAALYKKLPGFGVINKKGRER